MISASCRNCGIGAVQEIGLCSACGGPDSSPTNDASAQITIYASYADVPWFRKRWFAVVSILFFSPAVVFVFSTGEMYYEKNGQVRPLPSSAKYALIAIGGLAIVRIIALIVS
jgi:hypothetical protein